MDFSYVFTLSKKGRTKRSRNWPVNEIEASWEWRKGNVDETLQKKLKIPSLSFNLCSLW
jgi:hypothetical protein